MQVHAIKLSHAMLLAALEHDPDVDGADQSHPTGLVQCFRLSSMVGRRNVLVLRYLWSKSIADTLLGMVKTIVFTIIIFLHFFSPISTKIHR